MNYDPVEVIVSKIEKELRDKRSLDISHAREIARMAVNFPHITEMNSTMVMIVLEEMDRVEQINLNSSLPTPKQFRNNFRRRLQAEWEDWDNLDSKSQLELQTTFYRYFAELDYRMHSEINLPDPKSTTFLYQMISSEP